MVSIDTPPLNPISKDDNKNRLKLFWSHHAHDNTAQKMFLNDIILGGLRKIHFLENDSPTVAGCF